VRNRGQPLASKQARAAAPEGFDLEATFSASNLPCRKRKRNWRANDPLCSIVRARLLFLSICSTLRGRCSTPCSSGLLLLRVGSPAGRMCGLKCGSSPILFKLSLSTSRYILFMHSPRRFAFFAFSFNDRHSRGTRLRSARVLLRSRALHSE
jgi:hypothetical protein